MTTTVDTWQEVLSAWKAHPLESILLVLLGFVLGELVRKLVMKWAGINAPK